MGSIRAPLAAVAACLLLAGCAALPPVPDEAVDTRPDLVEPLDVVPHPATNAVVVILHPDTRPGWLSDYFDAHPHVNLTIALPAGFFADETRRTDLERLRALTAAGRLEPVLTLQKEPLLPLLANVRIAAGRSDNWEFDFERPEDIAGHVGAALGLYQQTWRRQPTGILPPYFGVSEDVLRVLERFRITWIIGSPHDRWGMRRFGNTDVIVSDRLPDLREPPGSPGWVRKAASHILSRPMFVIDGRRWPFPETTEALLEAIAEATRGQFGRLARAEDPAVAEQIPALPADVDPLAFDFHPWTRTHQQRLAWRELARARTTVDAYRNSGRADLRLLDAAMEEIREAQSGPFLLALGQADVPLVLNKRHFVATLSNVYRLVGVRIPNDLTELFERTPETDLAPPADDEEPPVFIEEPLRLTWIDPNGDDHGDGTYSYPAGPHEPGMFDLRSFAVSWTDTRVTFSARFKTAPESAAIVQPLVDVYVDINRLPGAGSTDPLPNRTATQIDRQAAWEFAVAFSAENGALYHPVPGRSPRLVRALEPERAGDGFSVSVPRSALRGEPRQWRFSVAVGGEDRSRAAQRLTPVPVSVRPTERTFGGALPGRTAPPFIDLLAATAEEQRNALRPYGLGRNAVLPFVEVP